MFSSRETLSLFKNTLRDTFKIFQERAFMKHSSIIFLIFSFYVLWTDRFFAQESMKEIKEEVSAMKEYYNKEIEKLREELKQYRQEEKQKNEQQVKQNLDTLLDKYLKESGKEPLRWSDIISPHHKIKFYGFIRLDMDYDSHRTNDGILAGWVNNRGPSPDFQDEELNIHARYTRFGFDLNGGKLPTLGGPELSGKLELDFFNGGGEGAYLPRVRHAMLKLNWTDYDFYLIAGQTADIISPLAPDTVEITLPGRFRGNPGYTRPQLSIGYIPTLGKIGDEPIKLSLKAGIFRSSIFGTNDVDSDGNNDGEDSGLPMLQWRVGIDIPAFVSKKPIQFGVYGSHAWEETQSKIGTRGEDHFKSTLIGIDFKVPIHEKVTLSTELFWGKNVEDHFAAINQGINTVKGKEIETVGGWFSAKINPIERLSISFGYMFDNPQDEDVVDNANRRFVSTIFINNVWDLGSGVSVGYEYQYMLTYYNRRDASNYNNRAIVYFMYSF